MFTSQLRNCLAIFFQIYNPPGFNRLSGNGGETLDSRLLLGNNKIGLTDTTHYAKKVPSIMS